MKFCVFVFFSFYCSIFFFQMSANECSTSELNKSTASLNLDDKEANKDTSNSDPTTIDNPEVDENANQISKDTSNSKVRQYFDEECKEIDIDTWSKLKESDCVEMLFEYNAKNSSITPTEYVSHLDIIRIRRNEEIANKDDKLSLRITEKSLAKKIGKLTEIRTKKKRKLAAGGVGVVSI